MLKVIINPWFNSMRPKSLTKMMSGMCLKGNWQGLSLFKVYSLIIRLKKIMILSTTLPILSISNARSHIIRETLISDAHLCNNLLPILCLKHNNKILFTHRKLYTLNRSLKFKIQEGKGKKLSVCPQLTSKRC